MVYTNAQIIKQFQLMEQYLFNADGIYINAKINFCINKNYNLLKEIYASIEQARISIIKHYGQQDDEGRITVPSSLIETANAELEDLLTVEHTMEFHQVTLSDLEKYDFTIKQMEALLFMIKED